MCIAFDHLSELSIAISICFNSISEVASARKGFQRHQFKPIHTFLFIYFFQLHYCVIAHQNCITVFYFIFLRIYTHLPLISGIVRLRSDFFLTNFPDTCALFLPPTVFPWLQLSVTYQCLHITGPSVLVIDKLSLISRFNSYFVSPDGQLTFAAARLTQGPNYRWEVIPYEICHTSFNMLMRVLAPRCDEFSQVLVWKVLCGWTFAASTHTCHLWAMNTKMG